MLRLVRLLLLLFSFSFSHNFGLLSYGVSLLAFRGDFFVVYLGTPLLLSAFVVSVCVVCLWFLSLYWPPF